MKPLELIVFNLNGVVNTCVDQLRKHLHSLRLVSAPLRTRDIQGRPHPCLIGNGNTYCPRLLLFNYFSVKFSNDRCNRKVML